jgi:hypothetical protein
MLKKNNVAKRIGLMTLINLTWIITSANPVNAWVYCSCFAYYGDDGMICYNSGAHSKK